MFLILCITILLLFFLRFYVFKSRREKLYEKIPGPKPYPIVGNIFEFNPYKEEVTETFKKLSYKYGPVYYMKLGSISGVCLRDPADVEIILNSTEHLDKGDVYWSVYPFLNEGLITSKASKWKKQRKILTPAFHFKILEGFVPVFVKSTKVLLEIFSKNVGRELDVTKPIKLCALDLILETSMGITIDAQTKDSEYIRALEDLLGIISKRDFNPIHRTFLFDYLPTGRKHTKLIAYLHGVTENIIKERKAKLQQNINKKIDKDNDDKETGVKEKKVFLDLLLQYNIEGAGMSDDDIRQEVDTFMFAGFDTSSATLVSCLYALSQHQDIQDKVYEEICSVFGDDDRDPTYSDLVNLKYLEKVIKETLRRYSTVPLISRNSVKDIKLPKSGYTIPENTAVNILIEAMNLDPAIHPEPYKFDPDRFEHKHINPYSFTPFSAGPRNCIGQKYAMLEIKAVISMVVRKFRLLSSDDPVTPLYAIVLRFKTGCKLRVEPRVPSGST